MRLWSVGARNQHVLQQTCVFTRADENQELDARLLAHVTCSANAKFVAGAMDTMVNIWSVAGKRTHE